jgi:hypothetical protein
MDTRIVMRTDNLDPLVSRLLRDDVSFLALQNDDHSFSLFLEIPVGIFVEIVSWQLTLVIAERWDRCQIGRILRDGHIREAKPSPGKDVNSVSASPVVLQLHRFVYASTNPAASAHFLARYVPGKVISMKHSESGNNCSDNSYVSWRHILRDFEVDWVFRPAQGEDFGQLEIERYITSLHKSFSELSVNHWHHYLDYHSGIIISDCDPLLKQLREDRIPYFLGKNRGLLGVFVHDPVGITHELLCSTWSTVRAIDLEPWNFCCWPDTSNMAPDTLCHSKDSDMHRSSVDQGQ